jgi:hypothetical protein
MNIDAIIYEKIKIFEWFIDGLGLHCIPWALFGGLSKEWISENYNVDIKFFEL